MPREKKGERNARLKQIVEELRKGGWVTPKKLSERLALPERTVDNALKNGKIIGIFKQKFEEGPYAWIDYSDAEPLIQEAIKDYLDSHSQLRKGERSISYVDIDEIIETASERTGRPTKEIEKLARSEIRKFFEERKGK